MYVVFFDIAEILLDHAAPCGATANGNYYLKVLRTKLRPSKRPHLLEVILHDITAPHRKHAVVATLNVWEWASTIHQNCHHVTFSVQCSEKLLRGRKFADEHTI